MLSVVVSSKPTKTIFSLLRLFINIEPAKTTVDGTAINMQIRQNRAKKKESQSHG
jgi:hypothetical protein